MIYQVVQKIIPTRFWSEKNIWAASSSSNAPIFLETTLQVIFENSASCKGHLHFRLLAPELKRICITYLHYVESRENNWTRSVCNNTSQIFFPTWLVNTSLIFLTNTSYIIINISFPKWHSQISLVMLFIRILMHCSLVMSLVYFFLTRF